MEISYQKNVTQSFLVIQENSCIEFELEMLKENQVYRLIKIDMVKKDSKIEYWYDITGVRSIQDYLGNQKMEYKLFCILYLSIYKILLEIPKYLLEQQKLCLDLDKIYIDPQTEKIYLCYFPFEMEYKRDLFLKFMESVLSVFDHRNSYAVETIYHIYEMARQGSYNFETIKEEVLQKMSMDMMEQPKTGNYILQKQENEHLRSIAGIQMVHEEDNIKKQSIQKEDPRNDLEILEKEKVVQKTQENSSFMKKALYGICEKIENNVELPKKHKEQVCTKEKSKKLWESKEEKRTRKGMRYHKNKFQMEENTFSYDPCEEVVVSSPTVLLHGLDEVIGILRPLDGGDEIKCNIDIEKEPFFIGSKESVVHAVIFSKVVSKIHAKIYKKNELYYIEDLNSTNGTWVDEILIPCNTPYNLKKYMKVKFANISYEFI